MPEGNRFNRNQKRSARGISRTQIGSVFRHMPLATIMDVQKAICKA